MYVAYPDQVQIGIFMVALASHSTKYCTFFV